MAEGPALSPHVALWMSTDEAAAILGVPVVTLRRAIERGARRLPNGVCESILPDHGVRARKFGRNWRVQLEAGWTVSVGRAS